MTEVPLVLVTGLAGPQAQTVADKLASRDTAVVHHDLGGVSEGVVVQRLRLARPTTRPNGGRGRRAHRRRAGGGTGRVRRRDRGRRGSSGRRHRPAHGRGTGPAGPDRTADRAAILDVDAPLATVPTIARRGASDTAHSPLLRGQPPLHSTDGVATVLFSARRPCHPQRLHDALDVLLDGVVRARGRLWVAIQPNEVLYLESAGKGVYIGRGGPWLAALDDWSRVDPSRQAMAALRWDEHYGDREQALVTLSYDADPAGIEEALHNALLTDAELAKDPSGWPDPFGDWHTDPCTTSEHASTGDDEKGHA